MKHQPETIYEPRYAEFMSPNNKTNVSTGLCRPGDYVRMSVSFGDHQGSTLKYPIRNKAITHFIMN